MSLFGKLKCILGFHEWQKFMGPEHVGNGNFAQKYKCKRCWKIKTVIK